MFYLFCFSFLFLLIVLITKFNIHFEKGMKSRIIDSPARLFAYWPTRFLWTQPYWEFREWCCHPCIPHVDVESSLTHRPSWPSWVFCEAAAWEEIWCRLGVAFWIPMAFSMSKSRMSKGPVPRWAGVGTSPFCGVRWMHPMAGLPWKSLALRTRKLRNNRTQQTYFWVRSGML